VDLGGNTTEVIRRQYDGTWRYVIDDPFSVVWSCRRDTR